MRRTVPDECDVLLREGGIAHLRPLRPGDDRALHALVDRSSERSAYLRFFTGGRAGAHAYVDHVTRPDHPGRVLVAVVNGRLAGIAEYIPGQDGEAEIAILVGDSEQHHGLGTLLVEHLAVQAAEEGVRELVAEVLAENRPMLRVLDDLGLATRRSFDGGTVEIRMDPRPTPALLERIESRARQATSACLSRLFRPRAVAVVGAGRAPSGVGHHILRNLVEAGFPGPVYPVNPHAETILGLRAYPNVREVPGPVDLAVVAVPALAVPDVARDCARHEVRCLNSGGPQVLAADACERDGLLVPELSPVTRGRLRSRLPAAAAVANPVDLTAGGSARDLVFAVETVLADPGVDAVLVVYTPPFGSGLARTRQAVAAATATTTKTVVACVSGHDGLLDGRVPCYASPEQAVRALGHAVRHAAWRRTPQAPPAVPPRAEVAAARALVEEELARRPEGGWLDHASAARLLGRYGVRVLGALAVDGPEAAAAAAGEIEPPVALKATGPGLVHKSDVGGVRLGLTTPQEVRRAYLEMAGTVGPAMTGALVQPMAEPGVEMIVGGVAHESFGPLLMVGMGGVAAELVADHSFRVPPLGEDDPAAMLAELKCAPLLSGYRGRPAVDVAGLRGQIAGVGRLLDDLPQVAELDLNPVMVTASGAVALDVRVRLAPAAAPPSPFRRRLR